MRIGIYGGSFDPVHLGHLLLAESCREQIALDYVLFVPAGQSPLKSGTPQATGAQRADMLEFSLAGCPEYVVDRRELKRTGPSYTVETLRELNQEHPQDDLFLLLGADAVADFAKWREPAEIAELARLVIVNRGTNHTPLESLTPIIGAAAVERCLTVSMPAIDLSASEIRARVLADRSLRFRVPRAVAQYISQQELYLGP